MDAGLGIPEHREAILRAAYELGCEHARNAASWVNTDARLLTMLNEGDPQVWDYLPRVPDLSGEWADGLTPVSLFREVTGVDPEGGVSVAEGKVVDALCDAYEAGVSDTFAGECERVLRASLGEVV